jgi:hypothetical protein
VLSPSAFLPVSIPLFSRPLVSYEFIPSPATLPKPVSEQC